MIFELLSLMLLLQLLFSGTDKYCLISGENREVELMNLETEQTWKHFNAHIHNVQFDSEDTFFHNHSW